MNTIILVTSSFPFDGGEQFIEQEILFWRNQTSDLAILPATQKGKCRDVPSNVRVLLSEPDGTIRKLMFAALGLMSPMFWREVLYLKRSNKLAAKTVVAAIRAVGLTLLWQKKIDRHAEQNGNNCLIYCYWNDATAFAACLLKGRGKVKKVVSRIHGGDLYEFRNKSDYLPLKRQFVNAFDKIFAISQQGADYLVDTFGFPASVVDVAPLGVEIASHPSHPSSDNVVRVISVSNCIPVKRIDRILAGLLRYCSSFPTVDLEWHHFGDGPLRQKIEFDAVTQAGQMTNFRCHFHGKVANSEIKKFYCDNPIDVILNTSESEGVPVSIMEAMAAGVPAIAPNIGGIPSLIGSTGILLSATCIPEDIVCAINVLVGENRCRFRASARHRAATLFNSEINYANFVRSLCELASA